MKTFVQYLEEKDLSYRLQHRPSDPRKYPDEIATADTITKFFPKDFLDKTYQYLPTRPYSKPMISLLKQLQGKPNSKVTIYRGAPSNGALYTGDWVTLSKEYAMNYAYNGSYADDNKSKVYKYDNVKASDLSFDGDEIHEFGYWGPDRTDGVEVPPR